MGSHFGVLGFLFVSLCVSFSVQSEESLVPVLIWNYQNPADLKFSHNSLHNVDTSTFTSHLQKIIKKSSNPLVLAFIEPLMSVEDFSAHPTPFNNIREQVSHSKLFDYISSVYEAPEGIRNLKTAGYTVKEISDQESVSDNVEGVDVLIVRMSEPEEDRFNELGKHDKFIADAYRAVLEVRKNVIGVLTSELSLSTISSLIRHRRSDGSENATSRSDFAEFTAKDIFSAANKIGRAMLYSKEPAVLSLPTGEKFNLLKTDKTTINLDDRQSIERLSVSFFIPDGTRIVVRFRFDKDVTEKWSLKNVELESSKLSLEANLTTSFLISSTLGKAFSTQKQVEFSNPENIKLVFPAGLTAQPWVPNHLGERFGDVENNVLYFTPGIWMGIFVMAILALVFTLGMVMIMDIKTMDRFDDAKGKTITINATD